MRACFRYVYLKYVLPAGPISMSYICCMSCRKSLPALILCILMSCINSKTIHNKVASIVRILYLFDGRWQQHGWRPLMDLPVHWLERWVNREQSNQALYLLACGDSKLDEARTLAYLFTDLRPVHVLQNTWCARPVCSCI